MLPAPCWLLLLAATARAALSSTRPAVQTLQEETEVAVETLAYWRFEESVPSAFWRAELALADHSGAGRALEFSDVPSARSAVDGLPQPADCSTGSCTYLLDEGYFAGKAQDPAWAPNATSFALAAETAPWPMFNAAASRRASTRLRTTLYAHDWAAVPAGGGAWSFDAAAAAAGARLTAAGLAPADDLTLEVFFRADSPGGDVLARTNGSLSANTFALSLGAEGQLQLELEEVGGVRPQVTLPGPFSGDGQWHYAAAQLQLHAAGAGTASLLTLRALSEDGARAWAQADVDAAYEPSGRAGDVVVGEGFAGLVDEVRVSAGLVPERDLLGALDNSTAATCEGERRVLAGRRGYFDDGSGSMDSYAESAVCEVCPPP